MFLVGASDQIPELGRVECNVQRLLRRTGIGLIRAGGSSVQRVGLQPDVEVYPTIAGIRVGRDELSERGVAVILERAR